MQKNIWAKTILTSYRFLEKVSDAIDRLVETRALNSFYMGGNNFSQNNVFVVSESLINLTERKKKLINLSLLWRGPGFFWAGKPVLSFFFLSLRIQ